MKHFLLILVLIFQGTILSSCANPVPVEDLAISLILGIDLDDENNLLFSISNPVFDEAAEKKLETHELKADSIRASRKYFDALSTGQVTAAKIQILLIGKEVLKHENWFSILDSVYRNPAFSINTDIIVVDGPVSDVIFFEPDNKPLLPLHLKEFVEKNIERTRTVHATVKTLHTEMYDKGLTPAITEIKKGKDIELVGVSMLGDNGKYRDTFDIDEPSLLLLLRDEMQKELTLTIPVTSLDNEGGIFHRNELSLDIDRFENKVKTNYEQDQFHFTFEMSMTVNIVERLFPDDALNNEELEKKIEEELKSQFESVIKKIQKNKVDPIGLGPFARAYHYEQYKKVQERWGETLANSKIDISLDLNIKSTGAIQ